MTDFMLVGGAWLGSWVWAPVARALEVRGHRVRAVTLSGLAERADLPVAEIGLATHVADVRTALAAGNLRDVVLVGHSYSGIVTGQVAAADPGRVAHAVFVDANLPVDGASMLDGFSPGGREFVRDLIAGHGGRWPVPEVGDLEGHDLTGAQAAWLVEHFTGHPGRTLTEPAVLARPLAELSATYVACLRPEPEIRAEVQTLCGEGGWTLERLDTGHWPMVSRPAELTELLDGLG